MTYSTLKKLQEVFESGKRIAVCKYDDDGYHHIGTIDSNTSFEEIDRLTNIRGNEFFVLNGCFINYNEEINFD